MDNTLVSARVSRAKKDAVSSILNSIGVTTSDLINNAFDYVLEKKRLPLPESDTGAQKDMQAFKAFVEKTTLEIEWGSGPSDSSYKDIIVEGRICDYESLA